MLLPSEYYLSIDDMMLYSWIKIMNGDKTYCRRNLSVGNAQKDIEAYDILHDDYIKRFGLSKYYKQLLDAIKQKALAEIQYALTKDRHQLTIIEIKTLDLENKMNGGHNGMTIEQMLVHLGRWMGTWLSAKEISVTEYFLMVEEYKKSNEKILDKHGKKN
jgi:RNAse (barnase) inhibitor barstar